MTFAFVVAFAASVLRVQVVFEMEEGHSVKRKKRLKLKICKIQLNVNKM